MRKIKDINISKLFPSVIYRRGLEYFRGDRVSDLVYDMPNKIWTATVSGTEDYFVEINMREFEKGTIETFCTCPAYGTFNSCKHIVAVLLSMQKKEATQPEQIETGYDFQITDQFIEMFRTIEQPVQQQADILTDKSPLQVEYFINADYSKRLILELKIGKNRAYVVKDIFALLRAIFRNQSYYFTKKFTYDPAEHYILGQDLEILEQLYNLKKNEAMYQSATSYLYEDAHDKRTILIPPMVAKDLIAKLLERHLTVEIDGSVYQSTSLEENTLPFEFLLEKNNVEDVLLKLKHRGDITVFSDYEMIFSEGIFYFPTREQFQIIRGLERFNLNQFELPISKKQTDHFFSEVIPSLKTVGDVQVDESIEEEIIQLPLQAKMYLELKEDVINGKLEYYYGSYYVDPFNGREKNDVIIIRDVEKEQQIMQLIEYANFRYNGKELYLETEEAEELYAFLYQVLPQLSEQVELYLTSDLKQMVIEHEPTATTNISLDTATNLLEISFDIDGLSESEVNDVLSAVIEKKRFYRLNSGAVLSLESESFSSLQHFFGDLEIKKSDFSAGDGTVQMPAYRGTQIDELIETKKSYDPAFHSLIQHLRSPDEQVFELPQELKADLRNYQVTGFQWFKSLSKYHLGGILADDMGLGKTLQTIAYLASERSDQLDLIVVPSSVVYNWKNEFAKFTPHLEVAVMTGPPAERKEKMQIYKDVDVWITSYATLRQDIEIYRELNFHHLILDEAQFIKNYATKTSQAMRQIKAAKRFALSGTPIENSIEELWSIFQVVLPGMMPSRQKFKQLSNEKIASITKPFILRRLKKDVLKELPEKIESVSVSELTHEQKELYVGYLREVQNEATSSMKDKAFNQNRMKILAGLTRLRQICCHPSLFIENYEGESGKLIQLMETIKTALENGKRMLIFSQFTSMHEIIMRELEKVGLDYFYLSGKTPSEERLAMSERFNNGEKDIFLISLKAGGTGLNLTGADTVILYDLWWNPAVEDQATGRAHRFGQKNVVQVIRLIAEGTIEEKIYDLQQKKRELINQVIQPGETMLSSLSEEDIRELLSL